MSFNFSIRIRDVEHSASNSTCFELFLLFFFFFKPRFLDRQRALPLCDHALQQNETVNVFRNEFAVFEHDDLTIGNKAENNVKDLYTLSDLQYRCASL